MDHEPMYDKEQDWLGQSQDNMSGWNGISTMSIVFSLNLYKIKSRKPSIVIIKKTILFLSRCIYKIAYR